KLLYDLSDARRRQILVVSISNLHCRRGPARTQALGGIPTEFAVSGDFASFDAELFLDFIDARINSSEPATHILADVDVMLPRRFLMKHRVERRDTQHIRRRIAHQPADVFGDLL